MGVLSYNLTADKTVGVNTVAPMVQLVGVHYFFLDSVRAGVLFQFSEFLNNPAPEQSRFAQFAVIPAVGWNFYGPLFAGLGYIVAPWTLGGAPVPPSRERSNNFDMGVQAAVGAAIPLGGGVRLTGVVTVPFTFVVSRTISLAPLIGIAIPLGCVGSVCPQ
jgi:hypothetical protein